MLSKKLFQAVCLGMLFFSSEVVVAQNNTSEVALHDIKKIIKSIHKHLNQLMQTMVSSKDSEEHVRSWEKRSDFESMQRQIMSLNKVRFIKKLVKAISDEAKDVVEKLAALHRDVEKHNKNFKIDDTFGYPSSRRQDVQNLNKTKEILSELEVHINHVTPSIDAFLKKHEGEAALLTTEAQKQRAKSVAHAKDSKVRRPSKIAEPLEETPEIVESLAETEAQVQQAETEAEDTKSIRQSVTPYEEIERALQNHTDTFPPQHEQDFVQFLRDTATSYPNANKPKPPAPRPIGPKHEEDWIYGRYLYKGQGFHDFTKRTLKTHTKFAVELEDMEDVFNMIEGKIPTLLPDELSKLSNHPVVTTLKSRIKKYQDAYNAADEKIQDKFHVNVAVPFFGPSETTLQAGPLLDPTTHGIYKKQHDHFIHKMQEKFAAPLESLTHSLEKNRKKIQQYQQQVA